MFFNFTSDDPVVTDFVNAANEYGEEYTRLKSLNTKPKPLTLEDKLSWIEQNKKSLFTQLTKALNEADVALTPAERDITQMAKDKEDLTVVKGRLTNTLNALRDLGVRRQNPDLTNAAVDALNSMSAKSTANKTSDASLIRKWASENGIQVNAKGRIPADIVEKYNAREN